MDLQSRALLDSSALIAVAILDHVHHEATRAWLADPGVRFATTPITQGSLIRYLVRSGATTAESLEVLESFISSAAHEFWPDDIPFGSSTLMAVRGHADVTDAYLAELARCRGGRLATLDRRLGDLHPDVAVVIPS